MTIITIVIDEKGDVTIDVESFTGMGSQVSRRSQTTELFGQVSMLS